MDFGQRLSPGRIAITAKAYEQIPRPDVEAALRRSAEGVRRAERLSTQRGVRLLSASRASNGVKFWTITEADRSLTTVLLPEDY